MAYDDSGMWYPDPGTVDPVKAKPDWAKPDLLKRVIGNVLGNIIQVPAIIPGVIGAVEQYNGQVGGTWAQESTKRANDLAAQWTGVPHEERTLVDEALSAVGPAGIVAAPIKLGANLAARAASGVANFLLPTTTAGGRVVLKAATNAALPPAIIGGLDTALGGDVVARTAAELNPLSPAGAATTEPKPGSTTTEAAAAAGNIIDIPDNDVAIGTPTPTQTAPPIPTTITAPNTTLAAASSEFIDVPDDIDITGDTTIARDDEVHTFNSVAPEGKSGVREFVDSTLGKMTIAAGLLVLGGKIASKVNMVKAGADKISFLGKLEGGALDRSAPIREALERTGSTPDQVEKATSIINRANATPIETQIKNAMTTGHIDGFGSLTTAYKGGQQTVDGYLNEVASLDPAKRDKISRAIQVGTEIDNRTRKTADGRGLDPILPGHTAELTREYNRALADPEMRSFMDRFQHFNHTLRDYLVKSGMFSRAEVNKMANANMHYMHYEWLGPFSNRASHLKDPGATPIPKMFGEGDPFQGLGSYITSVMREVGRNNAKREVINQLVRPNTDGSMMGKFVHRVTQDKPVEPHELPLTVTYRDGGEKDFHAVMTDPTLAAAMRNEPEIAGAVMKFFNQARNLEQSAQTGTIAAITGAPFGINTAVMSGIAGSFARDKGTSMGIVDKLLQKLTNGMVGWRGDPTWAVQAVDAFARDATSQSALYFARKAALSVDTNGQLTKLLGEPFMRAVSDKMFKAYHDSTLFVMRTKGAAHSGLHGVSDANFGQGIDIPMGKDYLRSVAPGIGSPNMAAFHKARTGLETILELIGSSANSAYFKQNRGRGGMSDDLLASKTRKLSGDPAEIGSSAWVQKPAAVIPYLNTAIQGTRTIGVAAMKDPLGVAGGAAVTFGMIPYLYQAYLSQLPPEYKEHYWQTQTSGDRASKVYTMYLPGIKPELAPTVQYSNELAPFAVAAMEYFGAMFGNTTGTQSVIGEAAAARRQSAHEGDMNAAYTRLNPAGMPAVLRMAASGLGGIDLSGWQKFGSGAAAKSITSPSIAGTPGHPDAIIDGVVGANLEHLLNQVPAIGQFLTDVHRALWTGEGVEGIIDRRKAVLADRTSIFRGSLWNTEARISTQNTDSKFLDERVGKMKEMIAELRDRGKPNQLMSSGRVFEGKGPAPMDPETSMAAQQIAKQYGKLVGDGGILAQRNVEYNNQVRIESSNMSAPEKRARKSEIAKTIQGLTNDALNEVERINSKLQDLFGISLDKINPNRNINGTRFDGR